MGGLLGKLCCYLTTPNAFGVVGEPISDLAPSPRTRIIVHHQATFSLFTRSFAVLGMGGILVLLAVVPQGESDYPGGTRWDEATGREVYVHESAPLRTTGTVLGVVAGYSLLMSPLLGYRYPIGWAIPARWRHRLHVGVGVGLLVLAVAHGVVMPMADAFYSWPSGIAGVLVLAGHGWLGARKTSLMRSWGAARWRFAHLSTAWLGLAIGLEHSLLMGVLQHG